MRRPTLIFIFIAVCASLVWAQDPNSATPRPTAGQRTSAHSTTKKILKKKKKKTGAHLRTKDENFATKGYLDANEATADTVDNLSNKLDLMLTGHRTTKKKTRSQVIVRNEVYTLEGRKQIDYKPRFDVRLDLPNLEEKWSLSFTSYDDDTEERGIERNRLRTAPRPENYGASVMLLKKLGDVDFTFRPKLQLVDKHLVTSHLMRFESEADMKTYKILPKLELFARADSGTGELFALNFEYTISEKYILALTNEEQYVDFQNAFSTNHELALLQSLNETQSMKYAALFESNDKPNFHLSRYSFYVLFRHLLYKDKLHYALSPRLMFPEENRYSHQLAFVFSLDLLF